MSLVRFVTVHCDTEDCLNWDAYGGGGHDAEEARRHARMVGWVRHGRRDYCPGCAKEAGLPWR